VSRAESSHVIADNRFISNKHCVLERSTDGTVTVTDHSSNGTHVNGARLVKGQAHVLSAGDEITLVKAKGDKQKLLAYEFRPADTASKGSDSASAKAPCMSARAAQWSDLCSGAQADVDN
jgi:pSer/pThr/pTyr-binding forkhead associated (FHA) protein